MSDQEVPLRMEEHPGLVGVVICVHVIIIIDEQHPMLPPPSVPTHYHH